MLLAQMAAAKNMFFMCLSSRFIGNDAATASRHLNS
jgi:hypothetical protein